MQRSGSQRPQGEHSAGRDLTGYQELRELLTGPEQRQLAEILKRLNDPVRRAEELGQALPDAIAVATARDKRIARALQPTIDSALRVSAHKNPKAIADAIFPALGPAIRKAISAALTGMVQSFNHILNQSLSWQGLKWRLEALRTRKSFAEVALLHTLVYRVEQIFLIHRHSGLLLQHAVAENIASKDPDLVSGMLTAIQDFVKDSFDTKTGEMLDTLRMDGDHSVWIEHGPEAVLAAVIRGMPPVELRSRFRDLLDHMHQLYGGRLDKFDGQSSSFAMLKPELEDALTYQSRQQRKRLSPLLCLLPAAGLCLAGIWVYRAYDNNRHWKNLVSQLRAERGIALTTARKAEGRYYIEGFKDPLARSIEQIVAGSGLDPDLILSHWQPYYALDETTVIQRAAIILQPPPTVRLILTNGALAAQGDAAHQWVKRFQNQAGAIPGIQGYDDSGLVDSEMSRLQAAIAALEQQRIYFKLGKAQLDEDQRAPLADALRSLKQIQNLKASMGVVVRIALIGQTDPTGRQAFNLDLSQKRAQAVLNFLIQNDMDPVNLLPIGTTAQDLDTASALPGRLQAYRSVIFKAVIGAD
jgi:outer membrane protein OmpA-like peptidoglycan-associated protein